MPSTIKNIGSGSTGGVTFLVRDPRAPNRVADKAIQRIAQDLATTAAANSPKDTGNLARGFRVQKGNYDGNWVVLNDVSYLKYVEFGTKYMRGHHMLGRALAQIRAKYGAR